jgi:uncharacterized lipoprotein YddW (UPF0748 family)
MIGCIVSLGAVVLLGAPGAPPPIDELRGVWTHASSTHDAAECDAVIATAKDAGLNCLYWLGFYWGGKCFFRNPWVDMPDSVPEGFDPLDYLIREGHRNGIEIHVRFVNGENGSREPGPFFSAHRDWAFVDSRGDIKLWYDFANPEVRQFQADLMVGLLEEYPDLDGIQFDFIRYEELGGSFSDAAIRGFAEETGIAWEPGEPAALPAVSVVRGNPVGEPTTAEVHARFAGGAPAITTNTVGEGGVLLLNWHAEQGPFPLVSDILRRAIAFQGADTAPVPLLDLAESAEWHAKYSALAEAAVRRAGTEVRWVGPEALAAAPAEMPLLIVPNCYRISTANLERLLAYARRGGDILMLDGPIFSIDDPLCQQLVGLQSDAGYLAGLQAIVPVTEFPLMPVRVAPDSLDAERYAELTGRWTEYQASCISELVAEVHRRAHAIKPDVVVSACVFHRRSSAEARMQYWHDWVKDGIIDHVLPMCYTKDNEVLRTSMDEWMELDPLRQHVIPGLGIYDIHENGQPPSPPQVVEQIRICREEGGFSGVVFFHLPSITPTLTKALRAGPFKDPAPRLPAP